MFLKKGMNPVVCLSENFKYFTCYSVWEGVPEFAPSKAAMLRLTLLPLILNSENNIIEHNLFQINFISETIYQIIYQVFVELLVSQRLHVFALLYLLHVSYTVSYTFLVS